MPNLPKLKPAGRRIVAAIRKNGGRKSFCRRTREHDLARQLVEAGYLRALGHDPIFPAYAKVDLFEVAA